MQRLTAITVACTLLQHLLLGCCWHHDHSRHACAEEVASHAHHDHGSDTRDEMPCDDDSRHDCEEGRCSWLADQAVPQAPSLERQVECVATPTAMHLAGLDACSLQVSSPHVGMGLALPVRAHLWNQILLI